jgi:hypothetical protein
VAKHVDKIGSFEDFKAPWETESGAEAEVDKPKLKRLMFNARLSEAKAQDSRDEAQEALTAAEKERDEAKAEAASSNGPEAQRKIDTLEKKVADLTAEKEARTKADEHEALRKDVIGDLDPKYAKYVVGEDREALEKSLEEVKTDFNLGDPDGDDNDPDDNEPRLRTHPRRLNNPTDPNPGKGSEAIDFDKIADDIVAGGSPFA